MSALLLSQTSAPYRVERSRAGPLLPHCVHILRGDRGEEDAGPRDATCTEDQGNLEGLKHNVPAVPDTPPLPCYPDCSLKCHPDVASLECQGHTHLRVWVQAAPHVGVGGQEGVQQRQLLMVGNGVGINK